MRVKFPSLCLQSLILDVLFFVGVSDSRSPLLFADLAVVYAFSNNAM